MENLQQQLLQQGAVEEERVEVNQRHLIDKILARYSAEFTVYRELIQNANDAGAKRVEIHFDSVPKPPSTSEQAQKLPETCDAVTVKNNGRAFLKEDWNRLRKIAEGNPDVEKVGYFGVGFFSTFSLCEEPFIQSGAQCMTFYWKGDQLFTKHGQVPEPDEWTSFYLKLREPMEVPNVEDFAKFLAMSLLFTVNLEHIAAYANGILMVSIDKKTSTFHPLESFGKLGVNRVSARQTLSLSRVETAHIQMDIKKLKSAKKSLAQTIFGMFTSSKPESTLEYEDLNFFLRLIHGHLDVSLPSKFIREMERTTKKSPPTKTKIQMIFSGYDEFQATQNSATFKDLAPFPDQGRVFIGFPTHQTTGIPLHIAAHLIPTVERENIDFVDRTLAVWNQEVLWQCGVLSRIVYELDLALLNRGMENSKNEPVSFNEHQLNVGAHLMKAFAIKPSTPSSLVSKIIRHSFFECMKLPLSIMSTHGVLSANLVRLPDAVISDFCRGIPVVPSLILKSCPEMLDALTDSGHLMKIQLNDVINELKRGFDERETIALLKWWIDYLRSNQVSSSDASRFCEAASIPGCGPDKTPVKLQSLRYYANIRMIPPMLPTPLDTLPVAIARTFSTQDLERIFGFQELSLDFWTRFIAGTSQFTKDQDFTESVLEVLSRNFPQTSSTSRATIISLLSVKSCIPTKRENAEDVKLVTPGEAYFKNVTLFPDLPVVHLRTKNVSDSFLREVGVRSHVELQMVFDRLDDLKWDLTQLTKYLASVQDKLSALEMSRLRNTPILLAEKREGAEVNQRYNASQLYAPSETFRKLGLRVLEWPAGKWKSNGPEAKFLMTLGLKTLVPVFELLEIASKASPDIRTLALNHFIEHYSVYSHEYHSKHVGFGFLPCSGPDLKAPSEVYTDTGCQVMGFDTLAAEWIPHAEKFGVKTHPPSSAVINRLASTPVEPKDAHATFAYLSSRVSDFSSTDWRALQQLKFIPLSDTNGALRYVSTASVYFKSQTSDYEGIFDYVDFGPGNAFLKACGVKDEPSPIELVKQLVRDPQHYLNVCGLERYVAMLRQVALHVSSMKQDRSLIKELIKSPFMIGFRRKQADSNPTSPTQTEDQPRELEYHLARAQEISIIDDSVLEQIFNPLGAPKESLLEDFYGTLGAEKLSKEVNEVWTPRGDTRITPKANELLKLIKERAPLLVYDYDGRKTSVSAKDALNAIIALEVVEVESIELKKTFRGRDHVQLTSSCCGVPKGSKKPVLFIAGEYDYFDVARVISLFALKRSSLNESLLLATLLSTSLVNLKRKGFPVDRILNRAPIPAKEVPKPSPPTLVPAPDIPKELPSQPPVPQDSGGHDDVLEQALALFPDCDENYLTQIRPRFQDLQSLCNHLLDKGYPAKQREPLKSSQPDLDSETKEGSRAPLLPPNVPDNQSSQGLGTQAGGGWLNRFLPSATRPSVGSSRPDIPAIGTAPNRGALRSALRDSARSSSNRQQNIYTPPTVLEVESQQIQCEVIPSQNLRATGAISFVSVSGARKTLPLFLDTRLDAVMANRILGPGAVVGKYPIGLRAFGCLLSFLSDVFEVPAAGVHVYYSLPTERDTVAFNSGRSLFFNYRHFTLSHLPTLLESRRLPSSPDPMLAEISDGQVELVHVGLEACIYWFLVFCHELAHNFVGPHNEQHGHYMSSYSEVYMARFWALLEEQGLRP